MRRVAGVILALLVVVLAQSVPARAGHEFPYYPSYYPQEIRIETIAPGDAERRLRDASLHAVLGADVFEGGRILRDIDRVEFLGSYVLAVLDGPASSRAARDTRCAMVSSVAGLFARSTGRLAFHPYPITPYHADYLYHFDRVEALKTSYGQGNGAGNRPRLRTRGRLAEQVPAPWRADGAEWDATIEEVDVSALLSARGARFDGWWSPPWLKEGWFDAYLLLIERIRDPGGRQAAEAIVHRLVGGEYKDESEKINLARQLVASLTESCEAVVLGYRTKRDYFNIGYSAGIENIAYDSHTGMNSAMFVRTVKLKDFIWNGWLRLGITGRPLAAWNPLGGFTDDFGRLLWSAVGDPALLPAPYSATWIPNRVLLNTAEDGGFLARLQSWFLRLGRAETISVPRGALIPEPGTGRLQRVGWGKTARAKIVYTALTSAFHDDSQMSVGDVLYPFVVAYTWGESGGREAARDPVIEQATAAIRARLAGVNVLRVNQEVLRVGDVKLTWRNPVVEVYLNASVADPLHAAALAPPWASTPWHVMVLMDEAVKRRIAAFSETEARRTGVEWLDLVRKPALNKRLSALVEEFESRAYVPAALKDVVTSEEARQRWRALRRFSQKYRHFLVTNGPYRLEKATENSAVLTVFRDLSYPRGIGSFDRYPIPHKGHIVDMKVVEGQLRIRAEVERVEKFQRTYQIVREALTDAMLVGPLAVRPECRYVGIGPDGRVVAAGTATYAGNGTFSVNLTTRPGNLSTVTAALFVDENFMVPEVKLVRLEAR